MRFLSVTAVLLALALPAFSQTVPVQFTPSQPGVLEVQFRADDPATPQDEIELLREFTNDPPLPVTIDLGDGSNGNGQSFVITDAPSWARISFMRFRILVNTDRPGDHEIYLSSNPDPSFINSDVLIWNGADIANSDTDAGTDDDTEDDTDILLDWRGYTEFNGESVNQLWGYIVADVTTPNVSTIASWGMQLFYRAFDNSICNEVTEIPFAQCSALVDLYNDTDGDNWTNYDGWMTTTTPCSWHGVSCRNGQVRGLQLVNNNLSGTLPASLGDLTGLEGLELGTNNLTGSIPAEFGALTSLDVFALQQNSLSGSIPESLGNLTALTFFDVGANSLTGGLPATFGNLTALTWLSVAFNNLTEPLPSELGQLTNLGVLSVWDNDITGPIPASLGNLTNLDWLYLLGNAFSGTIPESLGNLTALSQLYLNNNALTGIVPLGVAQRCAETTTKDGGACLLTDNTARLCIPDTAPYQAIGVNPIGGLPLITNCGNQAPVAQDDAVATAFETAIDIDVLANDADSDGDSLTVSAIIRAPSSGTVLITNNQIRYTPNAGFEGTDTFSYEVSDGQAAAEATVTVTVGSNPAITGNVRFGVDVSREITLGNIRSGRFVGVRGSLPPLSWESTTPLSDNDGDGVFTGTISFTEAPGTVLEYKFVYESADGSLVEFEGNVGDGGEFGNRTLSFTGSATLPLVFWNNVTGVTTEDEQPHSFALGQNYPNPFNPTTRIRYTLPQTGAVTLQVYDSQGRLVRTLVDGVIPAGEHHAMLDARNLPSGVYFYTLRAGTASATRALTLMK
ncbi:MAG: Ig-like domain-containing protein [Bacteroidota bacterium]